MTEQTDVMQADRDAAEEWRGVLTARYDEYEGDAVADLAVDFARHRLAHPPADQRLREAEMSVAIQGALLATLGDTYDCTRVWSAWGVGTMDQDDFVPVLDRMDEIIDEIAHQITALAAPLDDGWVMVPREPTETMVSAGKRPERHDSLGNLGTTYLGVEVKRIWHAMIAAAPTSPILSIGEGM